MHAVLTALVCDGAVEHVDAGAKVKLISGPTQLSAPEHTQVVNVLSAEEMYRASMETLPGCDLFIAAAAVADYRPASAAAKKIKKEGETMTLEMVKNPDIVSAVAATDNKPFVVGFAAETHDVTRYAKSKLKRKQLDLIIANDVSDPRIGFDSDDNAVTLIAPNNQNTLAKASKQQLAQDIIQHIVKTMNETEKTMTTGLSTS